ncbi:hypothetical protein [Actinomadura sp. B10D3]
MRILLTVQAAPPGACLVVAGARPNERLHGFRAPAADAAGIGDIR